jgi:hypothetical protein
MVSLLVVLLPVVAAVIWNVLDCNPSLFVYDKLMTMTGQTPVFSLEGKTIWITGASSGIGASLVCQLMEAKAGHGTYSRATLTSCACVSSSKNEVRPKYLYCSIFLHSLALLFSILSMQFSYKSKIRLLFFSLS